ncbi:hypothetical protein E1B28_006991 [Marasmius oreades]|uniref:Uncharacterized protein n=1 Tax=Marasmius oreades TaxID=181124 RepID=A0A9P7S1B0_9AGAR|nr:uncharacterized protein E1B28_006991 [Marasmius oreades]KAG7093308.1 hypothetical protein E1B28_006991 [Marasmius oreades]
MIHCTVQCTVIPLDHTWVMDLTTPVTPLSYSWPVLYDLIFLLSVLIMIHREDRWMDGHLITRRAGSPHELRPGSAKVDGHLIARRIGSPHELRPGFVEKLLNEHF